MPERAAVIEPEREVSRGRIHVSRCPLWEKTKGGGPNEEESSRPC